MKLTVERDALSDAIAALSVRRLARATVPILQHILITAGDGRMRMLSHDLNSCSTATIPAEIERAGSVALPASELSGLITAFTSGSQVRLDVVGTIAKIASGRARYTLVALSPDDFPEPLKPRDPCAFSVAASEIEWLFGTTQSATCRETTRPYLNGVCLKLDEAGRLTACATDAYRLVEVKTEHEIAGLPTIIVPRESVGDVLQMAKKGEVQIEIAKNAFSIASGDRHFTTRLIDAEFPAYEKIIPPANGNCLKIDRVALLRALQRIDVISTERSVARMQWDGDPQEISLKMDGNGSGEEMIECACAEGTKEGMFAVPAAQLVATLQVSEADTLDLFIPDSSQAMLIRDPNDSTFRALQMPVRWHRAGAKEVA